MKNKILIILLLFSLTNLYCDNPGDLDTTYNSGGTPGYNIQPVTSSPSTVVTDNALQADQKSLVTGSVSNGIGGFILFLSRFNVDGTLDTTFNSGGTQPGVVTNPLADTFINGIKVQSDQSIVIVGYTTAEPTVPTGNGSNMIVARFDSNGNLDSSFGTDPFGVGFEGIVLADFGSGSRGNSLVIQSDGKIIAVGQNFLNIAMARFNTDGSLDTTFGGTGLVQTTPADIGIGTIAVVRAIDVKLTSDEKILISGSTNDAANSVFVARYNNDGTLDTTFNAAGVAPGFNFFTVTGGNDSGKSLVVQDDQKIVVGVEMTAGNPTDALALVRFNADGTLDTSYGTNGVSTVQANATRTVLSEIAIQSSTQQVIAVGYNDDGINQNLAMAKFNTDGSLDSTFIDSNLSSPAGTVITVFGSGGLGRAVSIQDDRKIVASADFNGLTNEFVMARYLNGTFVTIDTPIENNAKPTITGTMAIGNTIVQVSIDGGSFVNATTVNSGAGTWSFTSTDVLSQGNHTVQATTTDPFGQIATTAQIPFTINVSTFVTITSPTINEVINNAQPTITGTMSTSNTIVEVSIDSGSFVSATSINSNAGTWSYITNTLSEGEHTVQARTTDPTGRTAQTPVIPFTINSTTFVTITSPTINEVVNNQRPLITGTMEVGNTIVQVSIDGGALQNAAVISGSGTWSFTPSTSLSQASHTVQAFTTDDLGNSAQTTVIPFTVNSETFVTITFPKNGQTISTSTPLLSGTTASGNTVEIIIDGVSAGFAIVDAAGHWIFQVTTPLSNGVHSIEIVATTPTGDVASVTISITVAATICIFPADILTQAIRNKYSI